MLLERDQPSAKGQHTPWPWPDAYALQCARNLRLVGTLSLASVTWNSDRIGPIGFCGQLGVIVVIGIQVERSARVH